jgi:hypothetical protein
VRRWRAASYSLVTAATANVHGVPLMTYNIKIIADKVDLREP